MKHTYYLVAALFILQGSLLATNGGGHPYTISRDPFYDICKTSINITHPIEGGSVYTNQVDINYTYSAADHCRYRTSGSWNTIPCNGSIRRTLSYGSQTLTVQAYNQFCIISDSVSFTVVDFNPSLVGDLEPFLLIPIIFTIWLIFDEERCRQRKRPTHQRARRW